MLFKHWHTLRQMSSVHLLYGKGPQSPDSCMSLNCTVCPFDDIAIPPQCLLHWFSVRLKGFTACSIGFSDVALRGPQGTNQRLLTARWWSGPFVSQDLKVLCKHFKQVDQACGNITHGHLRKLIKWKLSKIACQKITKMLWLLKSTVKNGFRWSIDRHSAGWQQELCRRSLGLTVVIVVVICTETKEKVLFLGKSP